MKSFAEGIRDKLALLFDVDGTLVDSNRLHAEAWAKALRKFGKFRSADDVQPWIGMGGDKILRDLAGIPEESDLGKAVMEYRGALFLEELAPKIKAFPGSAELIRRLHGRGFKLALATSAKKEELDAILEASLLAGLPFDQITTADDAEASKPDPDIIAAALTKLGVSANEAWMFGDTPYDVEAGSRAGVPVVALRSGGWKDAALKNALYVFEGVGGILQVLLLLLSISGCSTGPIKDVADTAGKAQEDEVLWPSWGGNLENTHRAVRSPEITKENLSRLKVQWVYETKGDVSAIPTVTRDHIYFPDWGRAFIGTDVGGSYLHAVKRVDGKADWTRGIESYGKNPLNSVMRTSMALDGDRMVFGDNRGIVNSMLSIPGAHGAIVYAVNRFTGELLWSTVLDKHPMAIVTQSPVIYQGRIYVGTSSNEEAAARITKACCSFRAAMFALDLKDGTILWKQDMVPPLKEEDGFTGNAIWGSQPAVDKKRGVVYIATGNNYTFDRPLQVCLKGKKGKERADCFKRFDPPNNFASSVLALDLKDGSIRWARKLDNGGAWTYACSPELAPIFAKRSINCEDPESEDFDFGQAPMLMQTKIAGQKRDIVAVGQKSGDFWAFDPDADGATLWKTHVGPGGDLGGMEFGSAADGERIYTAVNNFSHIPHKLLAGEEKGQIATGGVWTALNPADGKIIWQTRDPSSKKPLDGHIAHLAFGSGLGEGWFGTAMGPMTVANGLVFAGSMDREGHMYALDGSNGKIVWSFKSGGSVMSAPAIVDNVLYWGSGYSKTGFGNNKVYAFSLQP